MKCVKTGSNIEFQVKKGSDCIVPSVKKVFTVLTPGLSLDDASSKFINTDLYYLSSLKIEGSKAATVVGQAKSKIRLMGGYFDLVQVEGGQPPGLEVSWDITKSGLKLEDLEIKLSGTTKVASMPGTMEVEKPKGKAKFRLKLSYGGGQNLKLVDWMGHFQLYLPGMVDDAKDGIDIGKFSGLRFNNPNITGVFDVDDAFQIYCKDKVAHTQTFGFAGTEFYFIVNR